MRIQIIGRFEDPEAMVFYIGKELERKGMKGFEVKSTPNGSVYIESDNENAHAFAYDLKCRIEKLEAAE
jgi:hypothetical protein